MQEIKNKKILIVDDEKELLSMLSEILIREGFYNVYTACDCASALKIAESQTIALCLLDVNLPDGDGFSLFEKLNMPVIFLTARGEGHDRIRGLGLGADDYIVKPFLTDELILRITAVLKRIYGINKSSEEIMLSGVSINFDGVEVIKDGKSHSLTAKEYIILKKLWENKNRIVTSDALCMAAWGEYSYGYENTLRVHIRRLRNKIEREPSNPKHILTFKGLGYKLVTSDE